MTFQRLTYTRQRRRLSALQKKQASKRAFLQLSHLNNRIKKSGLKVALYYDGFGELPTQALLDWCRRMGHQAYLPVIKGYGNNKILKFAPVTQHKLTNIPTYRHSLGMRQQYHHHLLSAYHLDVIFCPLVAINHSGYRVGMGGGYYDRTLSKSHKYQLTKPLKVAWCYDFQLVEDGLWQPQSWDVAMDYAITPNQFLSF